MFFKNFKKYYYIVNINISIILIFFKNFINLLLHIYEQIFIFHDRDIKKISIAIIYHNKFIIIEKINSLLIKNETTSITIIKKQLITNYIIFD